MAEQSQSSSRWRHFLMMLPFFLIGVAIPVYFYGFSGDGPPASVENFAPSADGQAQTYSARRYDPPSVVSFARDVFERAVDTYVAPGRSPLIIKFGVLAALFVAGFLIIRLMMAFLAGAVGGALSFLVHKAAGPMFMGFLAVGSTWGIHQTVAEQYGMTWAATTVAITAAVATLFALAGVRVR